MFVGLCSSIVIPKITRSNSLNNVSLFSAKNIICRADKQNRVCLYRNVNSVRPLTGQVITFHNPHLQRGARRAVGGELYIYYAIFRNQFREFVRAYLFISQLYTSIIHGNPAVPMGQDTLQAKVRMTQESVNTLYNAAYNFHDLIQIFQPNLE